MASFISWFLKWLNLTFKDQSFSIYRASKSILFWITLMPFCLSGNHHCGGDVCVPPMSCVVQSHVLLVGFPYGNWSQAWSKHGSTAWTLGTWNITSGEKMGSGGGHLHKQPWLWILNRCWTLFCSGVESAYCLSIWVTAIRVFSLLEVPGWTFEELLNRYFLLASLKPVKHNPSVI